MLGDPRKRGLGRGLEALIGREAFDDAPARGLPVAEIRPGRFQPRDRVSDSDLHELVDSIRAHGILQPLLVRPVDDGYELVAGERRWRAARLAGLEVVPAIIRPFSDRESLEIALVENLQRADLTPVERARAYRRLHDDFGLTQEQIAERVGTSQPAVANTLRLLQLPDAAIASLQQGRISEGHARALLGLAHPAEIEAGTREVERKGLSVRETEAFVKRWAISRGITRRRTRPMDPNLQALQDELSMALQTKATIHAGRQRGRIILEFYSPADLERLLSLLMTDKRPPALVPSSS